MKPLVVTIQATTDDVGAVDRAVHRCLSDTLGAHWGARPPPNVERVFPAGTPGRRGKLFTLAITGALTRDELELLLRSLREEASIVDVGVPEPRRPM